MNLHQSNHAIKNDSPHLCVQWSDVKDILRCATVADTTPHLWIWALASEVPEIPSICPFMQSTGWYNRQNPAHLLTSPPSLSVCDTTQILRLHYLLQHEGMSLLTRNPPTQALDVLRALNIQIGKSIDTKNLGAWASLVQERITYLPYHSHPSLRMARRLSHVHTWYCSITPPPRSIIYLVFHIYLHLVYVGVTTLAVVTRLRNHMTNATSFQDSSTLHRLMLQVDMGGWGILPLPLVNDPWLASVRERHWRTIFKKWACNGVPPGISADGAPAKSRGWSNQRVLAVL